MMNRKTISRLSLTVVFLASGLIIAHRWLAIQMHAQPSSANEDVRSQGGVADTDQPRIKEFMLSSGITVEIPESLKSGKEIVDTRWAYRENVDCYPEKYVSRFLGNHRLYSVKLPAYASLTARLNSSDDKNINLYGFLQLPEHKDRLPQEVFFTPLCQADFNRLPVLDTSTREVKLRTTDQSYYATIGVAGATGVKEAEFNLELILKTDSDNPEGNNPKIRTITIPRSKRIDISDDIKNGLRMPVRWANTARARCFPATMNPSFKGKQLYYQLTIPAMSKVRFTLIPDHNVDLNLLAYRFVNEQSEQDPASDGGKKQDNSSIPLPPTVETDKCEISSSLNASPGNIQRLTLRSGPQPYDIVLVVASHEDFKEGRFRLVIQASHESATGM